MEVYSLFYSIPYVLIYLILLLLSIVEFLLIDSEKKYIQVSAFLVLIFFFGFRGYVGSDFTTYILWFNEVKPILNVTYNELLGNTYEPFFVLLASISKQLSDSYHFFVFLNTIIDFFILYLITQRYCSKKATLLLFFYFVFLGEYEINLLRNIKSILLFFYSLQYVYNRQLFKYIGLNLLGVLFHSTALFFIFLYPVLRFKTKRILVIVFIIGNVIYLLNIKYILTFVNVLGSLLGGIYETRAEYYLDTMDSPGITFSYIYILITFVLIFKNFEKIQNMNRLNFVFINIYTLYCFSYLFFNEIEVFKSRFGALFVFSVCFILTEVVYIYMKNYKRVLIYPLLFVLLLGRVVITNSVSPTIYDNLLFGILPYEKRIENMNSFSGSSYY